MFGLTGRAPNPGEMRRAWLPTYENLVSFLRGELI
jgi:hypothetical protein